MHSGKAAMKTVLSNLEKVGKKCVVNLCEQWKNGPVSHLYLIHIYIQLLNSKISQGGLWKTLANKYFQRSSTRENYANVSPSLCYLSGETCLCVFVTSWVILMSDSCDRDPMRVEMNNEIDYPRDNNYTVITWENITYFIFSHKCSSCAMLRMYSRYMSAKKQVQFMWTR